MIKKVTEHVFVSISKFITISKQYVQDRVNLRCAMTACPRGQRLLFVILTVSVCKLTSYIKSRY